VALGQEGGGDVPVAVADRLLFVQLPANQLNGQVMNFRYRKQGKRWPSHSFGVLTFAM
jgi:hypothetical protein